MALDAFIAGRYSGTYNAVDVGITEQGYELQQDAKAQIINQSDAFGEATIDLIYRGGDVFLQYESKAYKAGSTTPFWPWAAALGVLAAAATPIGVLGSDAAKAMVLTATAATPAVTTPATLTITKAILAPNNPARLLFDSRLRTVPVRLQAMPILVSTTCSWFTTT